MLNTEFYNNAFSETEKSIIKKITKSGTLMTETKSSPGFPSRLEKKKFTFINNVCLLDRNVAAYTFERKYNEDEGDIFWVFTDLSCIYATNDKFAYTYAENRGIIRTCVDGKKASVHPFIEITL